MGLLLPATLVLAALPNAPAPAPDPTPRLNEKGSFLAVNAASDLVAERP